MKTSLDVRPSPIAGQWYSANPRHLAQQIDAFIQQAHPQPVEGDVLAIMVPHAGHIYSGPVAGYAFAALKGLQPDVVIVASPMHYPYYEAFLTSGHEAYGTPLGEIPVERDAILELDGYLRQELGVGLATVRHDPEHSLEIELPFLQRVFQSPFGLIPVMVREQSLPAIEGLGRALAHLVRSGKALSGRKTVMVASTDLSHFYTQAEAARLDHAFLERVAAFDPAGVIRIEDEGKGFACGRGALAAVMHAARLLGADQARVLHYATSGDITGDYDRVVGYGAALFLRSNK